MKLRLKGKKGFTLVEVLVVVTILGVLAALILPKLLQNPEKARSGEARAMLGTLMRGEEAREAGMVAITGTSTDADWQGIGFTNNQGTGKYWTYTFVTADGIAATDCGAASAAAIATRNATAIPADVPASATMKLCANRTWKGTYPAKYLPTD